MQSFTIDTVIVAYQNAGFLLLLHVLCLYGYTNTYGFLSAAVKIQKTVSKSFLCGVAVNRGSAFSELMAEIEIKNGFRKTYSRIVIAVFIIIEDERFTCSEAGRSKGRIPVQACAETMDDVLG